MAARAAFERGGIAYRDVRWQEGRRHFEKADRLVPDHADYSEWAHGWRWNSAITLPEGAVAEAEAGRAGRKVGAISRAGAHGRNRGSDAS